MHLHQCSIKQIKETFLVKLMGMKSHKVLHITMKCSMIQLIRQSSQQLVYFLLPPPTMRICAILKCNPHVQFTFSFPLPAWGSVQSSRRCWRHPWRCGGMRQWDRREGCHTSSFATAKAGDGSPPCEWSAENQKTVRNENW